MARTHQKRNFITSWRVVKARMKSMIPWRKSLILRINNEQHLELIQGSMRPETIKQTPPVLSFIANLIWQPTNQPTGKRLSISKKKPNWIRAVGKRKAQESILKEENKRKLISILPVKELLKWLRSKSLRKISAQTLFIQIKSKLILNRMAKALPLNYRYLLPKLQSQEWMSPLTLLREFRKDLLRETPYIGSMKIRIRLRNKGIRTSHSTAITIKPNLTRC